MFWIYVMIVFVGDFEVKKEDVVMWFDRCK